MRTTTTTLSAATRPRRLAAAALLAAAGVALAGSPVSAGGRGGGGACPAFAAGSTLEMRDSCFAGVAHFTDTGVLTATNGGDLPHTLTAVDGSFDSGTVEPGGTFEVPLDETGIVRVYCRLHGTADGQGMAGVLLVGSPAALASPRGSLAAAAAGPERVAVPAGLGGAALGAAAAVALLRRKRPARFGAVRRASAEGS